MSQLIPWLVVLIYIVPIIRTFVSMERRAASLWSFGDSLRRLFPEDRFYRKIKKWEVDYRAWKKRHPLASYVNSDQLNRLAGRIEYTFGHLRDYTVGVYMMAVFVFDLTMMIFGDPVSRSDLFPSLFYHGFFALLSLWSYRSHVAAGLQMTEFMRVNPHVHPQEFFENYYRRLGPSALPVPARAERSVNPTDISYLTGKNPKQGYWPLIHGFYDTAIFARSAYKALEVMGPEYGREVFDVMSSLWGSRMLELFKSRLVVEGDQKFNELSGKIILVFNHKSHLDFVFNFFALSKARRADGRNIRIRYIAAKDHFVDNKLVYSGLGVGKLIESNDMVFVDRKGKGKEAILDACQKLGEKEVEIAMYPQGTRAVGNEGANGKRLDAGYYTTGTANSLKRDLGHLKKGCAFLAIDAATAVRDRNIPVHLVFIGIDGTATLVPKGSFKVQTEGTIRVTVGDHFTLNPEDVDGLEKPSEKAGEALTEGQKKYAALVDRIQVAIDQGLVKALGLHEKLRTRFLEEIKTGNLINRESLLVISHRLSQADRDGDSMPFIILDRIFALPISEQNLFLKDLAFRMTGIQELLSLRDKVTERLFRHRGKELKTMALQEKVQAKAKKVS
jgi:1-acyl-sn-glycerol-3-phosphate acyltransferase